jgi:DNA-binding response OmpR family regulator
MASSSPRILICDDEPSLRELMRIALDGGYDFEDAATAREALDRARARPPDLLLLDVMMPGPQTGLDVLRELRADEKLADTPVVMVSAFSSASDQTAALEAGADRFVPKPFDPDELAAIVAEVLAERP